MTFKHDQLSVNRLWPYSPFISLWFDEDQPPAGAGTGNSDGGAGNNNQGSDTHASFERFLQRHDNTQSAALLLFTENHGYRERIRQADRRIAELERQLPQDGARVLTTAEQTLFDSYQQLGTPGDWETLQNEHANLQRQQVLSNIATDLNYQPEVLTTLIRESDTVEVRQEQNEQGTSEAVPYITPAGQEEAIRLTEYASQHWQAFLPSLVVNTSQPTRRVVRQTISGSPPRTADAVDNHINGRYGHVKDKLQGQ